MSPQASSRGGKTYGYQQPQESGQDGNVAISAKKQQLIDAFEQLVDAMVGSYGADDDSGQGGATGTSGTTGNSTGGAGTGTSAGSANQGSSSNQGAAGESPQHSGTTSGEANGSKPGSDTAFELSPAVLRESYRMDRAREMARQSGTSRYTSTRPSPEAKVDNKHMSDSNKSPLKVEQEFGPSYGQRGRSTATSLEAVVIPAHQGQRPETAPAPPSTVAVPLDAYWASFGSAAERAQERSKIAAPKSPEVQQLELIIGTDDRVLVTNNELYPWRCICSLRITAQNGGLFVGTGWLVSPRLVLTAGHCVYLADEGGWASQIEVIPGRRGTMRPFGSVISRDFRSVRGWTIDGDRDYDYGAILLPESQRYGDELGWFGFANRADDYIRGITLNLSGYPGDGGKAGPQREHGTQWFNSRRVLDVNEKQISYVIDTWGGQSGSPVWEMAADGSRYGLAIHTWGTTVSNGATRITTDVFNNIVQWTGEAP
jgi:V8-like Glu-specific endopeptidase